MDVYDDYGDENAAEDVCNEEVASVRNANE